MEKREREGGGPLFLTPLPLELEDVIVSSLDPPSLLSLSFTCTALAKKYYSFHLFGAHFADACITYGHSALFQFAVRSGCPLDKGTSSLLGSMGSDFGIVHFLFSLGISSPNLPPPRPPPPPPRCRRRSVATLSFSYL